MSSFLSVAIIVFTLVNIAACWWWLTSVNSKLRSDESAADETRDHVWDGDLTEYNPPLPLWWLMLFYLTIIFGVAYLLLFPGLGNFKGLLDWSQTGQYEQEVRQARNRFGKIYDRLAALSIEDLAADEQAMSIGHRLYVNNCSVCHGSDARGAKGFPNLVDDDWLYGGDPANIETSVLAGRAGLMPPLAAAMGETEVEPVVQYVRSLSGLDHDAQQAQRGASQFALVCAACHGADGAGNILLGAPNLTDDIWLYGSGVDEIRAGIVNGRQNRMPAHKELLGEDRARIVAAYVYHLSRRDGGS